MPDHVLPHLHISLRQHLVDLQQVVKQELGIEEVVPLDHTAVHQLAGKDKQAKRRAQQQTLVLTAALCFNSKENGLFVFYQKHHGENDRAVGERSESNVKATNDPQLQQQNNIKEWQINPNTIFDRRGSHVLLEGGGVEARRAAPLSSEQGPELLNTTNDKQTVPPNKRTTAVYILATAREREREQEQSR